MIPIYKDPSRPIAERVEDLISRMTPEEKAAQTDMVSGSDFATKRTPIHACSVEPDTSYRWEELRAIYGDHGVGFVHDNYSTPRAMNTIQKWFIENSRLGIPVLFTGEALHGVSGTRATVFPVPLALGATFDKKLVREVGEAIGSEARALGIQEVLAPNLDVARDIRWGRTEETFGEDTYLSSRMAVSIVSGHMKDGRIDRGDAVISEPKHYCVHGMAEGGINCSPARVGTREVESAYLPVFEAAIREGGARNVMVSYNAIDGDLMMCSEHYLKEVLHDRFHMKGYTRADWGGVVRLVKIDHMVKSDREAIRRCINNGLDMKGLDYDYAFWEETVSDLIRTGEIPRERIDEIVRRVLTTKFELGLFEHPYTDEDGWQNVIRCEKHRDIARRAAEESVILLKNDGILPLSDKIGSIALIGPSSVAQKLGGYSPTPVGYTVKSVYECLKEALPGTVIRQADGCAITPHESEVRYVDGQPHLTRGGEAEIEDDPEGAVELARSCDVIVFVGGDNSVTSGEGADRCTLVLAGRQRELIRRLADTGKPVVLVLESGKPADLTEEESVCRAIVNGFFGGEFGAQAIVGALVGKFSPSGRLNLSWPKNVGMLPLYYSMLPGGALNYYEGKREPLYPFGYGLSYSEFAYTDLTAHRISRYGFEVKVTVKNTGRVPAADVVQLYVNDEESTVITPDNLLKGFERVYLQPGESREVVFTTDENTFSLINAAYRKVVEPGWFTLSIGRSSADMVLSERIYVD